MSEEKAENTTTDAEEREAGESADAGPTGPIVFQCATCRQIIGDSFSIAALDDATETITLTSASNILQSESLHTSSLEHDLGSTYHSILCGSCQTEIGKIYITTSRRLDNLRDLFTFDSNQLQSYAVGTSAIMAPGAAHVALSGASQAGEGASQTSEAATAVTKEMLNTLKSDLGDSLEVLKKDMTKVFNLILLINERLTEVEEGKADSKVTDTKENVPTQLVDDRPEKKRRK